MSSVDRVNPAAAHAGELREVRELALVPGCVTTGGLVLLVDPDLELRAFDAPGAVLADPDGRQLAGADEGVDDAHVDGEELRGIGEGQEPPELASRSR